MVAQLTGERGQERSSALRQALLTALVRDAFGVTGGAVAPFPGGAALATAEAQYVLVDETARSIGPALAVARRHEHGDEPVHVLAAEGSGRLAAQAAAFATPPTVWRVEGRELHPAEPEAAREPAAPPDAPDLVALLVAAGLDVIAEPGRIAGEVRGLEVARVAFAPDSGEPALEVGVGQADRELTVMLHGALAPEDALARVVELVDRIRRPGAEPHPLNRLVPERWLRWVVRGNPSMLDAPALTSIASPCPRSGLRDRDIACAVADDGGVVACSVGVDLDLVPLAAQARAGRDPDAELVLVVPERDVHPVTRGLAAGLRGPTRVVPVVGEWRTR